MKPLLHLFISYATAQSQLAHRVYGDIIKHGGTAYLYEKRSNDWCNFEIEIEEKIKEAQYFCLIDSLEARQSKYTCMECKLAKENRFIKNNRFFVLKYTNGDAWRYTTDALFKEINIIRYNDLSVQSYHSEYDLRFDTGERYNKWLKTLCNKLNLPYLSLNPDLHDLKSELNALKLEGEQVEAIKHDYESLLIKLKHGFPKINERINTIIQDCNYLKINIITPNLRLAAYLLQNNHFIKAKEVYLKLINEFTEDPRPFIGLMYTYCELKDYQAALNASYNAESIALKRSGNKGHKRQLILIQYHKIKLLITLKTLDLAEKEFYSLPPELEKLYQFQLLHLLFKLKKAEFKNEIINLKASSYQSIISYYKENIFDSNEKYLIAELEYEIARHFFNRLDYYTAITHYKSANSYDTTNPIFYAELSIAELICGTTKEHIYSSLNHFKNIEPRHQNEIYHLGFIHFLLGNRAVSKKYYKQSTNANKVSYKRVLKSYGLSTNFLG